MHYYSTNLESGERWKQEMAVDGSSPTHPPPLKSPSSSSSFSSVFDLLCEELFVEIMIKLSPKEAHRCKCVSKRWLDLISTNQHRIKGSLLYRRWQRQLFLFPPSPCPAQDICGRKTAIHKTGSKPRADSETTILRAGSRHWPKAAIQNMSFHASLIFMFLVIFRCKISNYSIFVVKFWYQNNENMFLLLEGEEIIFDFLFQDNTH